MKENGIYTTLANLDKQSKNYNSKINQLLQKIEKIGADKIDNRSTTQETLLSRAVHGGHAKIVVDLLNKGANPLLINSSTIFRDIAYAVLPGILAGQIECKDVFNDKIDSGLRNAILVCAAEAVNKGNKEAVGAVILSQKENLNDDQKRKIIDILQGKEGIDTQELQNELKISSKVEEAKAQSTVTSHDKKTGKN